VIEWPPEVEVAVPSYQRAELFRDRTMAVLARLEVPPEKVRVFVADDDERDRYERALESADLAEIVVGEVGLDRARACIRSFYDRGQLVLSMDDDVKRIVRRIDEKKVIDLTGEEFATLVDSGFKIAAQKGLRLWGIYPVANPYFMRAGWTTDLRFIGGGLFGAVNDLDERVVPRNVVKDDVERTLLYYTTDGGVVRCNEVSMVVDYYTAPGGIGDARSGGAEKFAALELERRFPGLAKAWTRKNGRAEVRLRDRGLK
jgi:hypothetical protein